MSAFLLFIPGIFAVVAVLLAALPETFRKARGLLAAYAAFLALTASVLAALALPMEFAAGWLPPAGFSLKMDTLSALFSSALTAALFIFFIYCFSSASKKNHIIYMVAASSACGAVLAGNFFTLLVFWGVLLAALYFALQDTDEPTAQRAIVVVGSSDFAMLLGVALMSKLTGTYDIAITLATLPSGILALTALTMVVAAAAAKAGAMPFHGWIISASSTSPVATLALFPAVADKILGIYLLVRVFPALRDRADFFQPLLLVVGAATLITAVLKALAQHDLKKLLAYHSVSQVGYMILGIASFHPLGVLGGVFHMFNNVVYKSGLFMGAGAVEAAKGTTEMSSLGSLSSRMPRSFISMLVSSMAISGVPPTNGFVSKWLIFQGLLAASAVRGNQYVLAALFLALAGSSLTLASFLKVIHSVFLAREKSPSESAAARAADAKISFWLPQGTLAALSLILGVLATVYMGVPILMETSVAAFLMIAAALVVGAVLFQFKMYGKMRRTDIFFGGEDYSAEYVFGGSDFYKTVENFKGLRFIYSGRESSDGRPGGLYGTMVSALKGLSSVLYYCVEKVIYLAQVFAVKAVEAVIAALRLAHTGEIYMYVSWYLVGAAILMLLLAK